MARRIPLEPLEAVAVSTDRSPESTDTWKSGGDSDGTSAFVRVDVIEITLPSTRDSDASGRGSARAPDPKKVRRVREHAIVGRLAL